MVHRSITKQVWINGFVRCFVATAVYTLTVHSTFGSDVPRLNHHDDHRSHAKYGSDAEPAFSSAKLISKNLFTPDGLALHPASGAIYVSEELAHRVGRIGSDGALIPVADCDTPIFGTDHGVQPPLRYPEGITFDALGHLMVAEDVPGGRLIRFALDASGQATYGETISLPKKCKRYSWESIIVTKNGELLLAGSNVESVLYSFPWKAAGVILRRDVNGTWQPLHKKRFASFSSISLSDDESRVSYVCEARGTIGWISLEGGSTDKGAMILKAKHPESISTLPDSWSLIAEEDGRLLMVNSGTGQQYYLPQEFSQIETALWDSIHQRIVFTEDRRGAVYALSRTH